MNYTNNITDSISIHNVTHKQVDVIEGNGTENYNEDEILISIDSMLIVMQFFWLITITLCLVTVCFGIVSWTLIVKWRQFRNYVFINVSFAGGLFTMLPVLPFISNTRFLGNIIMLGICSFVFWLLITSITFYVDVVKIFSYNYEHVYLKSNCFGWGLPALIIIADNIFFIDFTEFAMIGISLISIALYFRVLYTLMQRTKVRGTSPMTVWKKIRIATYIFLVSGCAMMLPMHLANQVGMDGFSLTVIVTVFLLQLIAINVLFLMMKSHRSLWREHLQRRRVRNNSKL